MKVTAYCFFKDGQLNRNGEIVQLDSGQPDAVLKKLYQSYEMDYPRFFKMDSLSKLGLIATESISMLSESIDRYKDDEIAQLFMNAYSSLDTDVKHQKMLNENKNPSPAVFVYTLANIVMGEIAIKKGWYGENLFILAPKFDLNNWLNEVQLLFETGKAKAAIGGWINLFQDQYDLKFFFVEKESTSEGFNRQELENLCNRIT